jgi:hypothetical protein
MLQQQRAAHGGRARLRGGRLGPRMPWRPSPGPSEEPVGIERRQHVLPSVVHAETVVTGEEVGHRLEWTRSGVRLERVAVHERVLHDQIAPGRHQRRVRLDLGRYMCLRVR